jgi:hypothetical protein
MNYRRSCFTSSKKKSVINSSPIFISVQRRLGKMEVCTNFSAIDDGSQSEFSFHGQQML